MISPASRHSRSHASATAIAVLLCLAAGPAAAQTQLQFTGDTTGHPTFVRPSSLTTLTGNGAQSFQAFNFRVRQSGNYQFDTVRLTHPDTYIHLYQGSFDPRNQLRNLVALDDDGGAGFDSRLTQQLRAGQRMTFVTDAFDEGQAGTYLFTLVGPGAIVLSDAEVGTAALQSGQDATRSFLDILNGQTWLASTGGSAAGSSAGGRMSLGAAPAMGLGMKDGGVAPVRSRTHVWAAGYGGDYRIGGDDGFGPSAYRNRNWGLSFGIDAPVMPGVIVGLAGAIGESDFKVSDIGGQGEATNFRIAAYGGWTGGMLYTNAAIGYGRDKVDTKRSFGFAPITGSSDIDELLASAEIGMRAPMMAGVVVNPFANIRFGKQSLDTLSESAAGSGGLALSISGRDDWWGRSILGVRFIANDVTSGGLVWRPSASIGWAHNFGDGPKVNATVAGAPGFVSLVDGAAVDDNQLHTGLDLTVESLAMKGLSMSLSYAGEYGDDAKETKGRLAIRYRW